MSGRRGPIEDRQWPEGIPGHVVDPSQAPRLHGYEVDGDLMSGYGFGEVVLTTLRGDAPCRAAGRAFEVAMISLLPVAMNDAAVHAASLARRCGARTSSAVSAGVIALAEQARIVASEHAELLRWLDAGGSELPPRFSTPDDADRHRVAALRRTVPDPRYLPIHPLATPTATAAAVAVLHACGLRAPEQIEAALVIARIPVLAAEVHRTEPGAFRDYPMNLPAFDYEDPR